jgi:hypothetical protein
VYPLQSSGDSASGRNLPNLKTMGGIEPRLYPNDLHNLVMLREQGRKKI